jgi:hypothetical protein
MTRTSADTKGGGGSASFATPAANSVNVSAPTAGAASTAIRSDATLQIDQAIIPSWTADHTWIDTRPVIKGVAAGPLPIQWWNTASGANASVYLSTSPAGGTDVTVALPNAPGQAVVTGSGTIPVSTTARIGKVNLTGQVANIAQTNLTNVTGTSIATGFYLITGVLSCTTLEALATPISLNIQWTGDGGAASAVLTNRTMTVLGTSQGTVALWLASGNVSYSVTNYTDPAGGPPPGPPTYAVRLRVSYLGA